MHLKYMTDQYSISIQDCHMVYMSTILESRHYTPEIWVFLIVQYQLQPVPK